jgi:molecular chaperone GrpE
VTTEATDKHEENTVIEEFQRGYKIGDRLLRPAKVKVASSPEK